MKVPFPLNRMTNQRRVLIETLDRKNWHPTADEVYQVVKKKAPKVSLGTVYRNLDILSKQGAITKIEEVGTQRLYDGNPKPHYHVKCLKCGKVCDVPEEAIKWVHKPLVDMPDFTITGHRLIFEGYCSCCRVHDLETGEQPFPNGN